MAEISAGQKALKVLACDRHGAFTAIARAWLCWDKPKTSALGGDRRGH